MTFSEALMALWEGKRMRRAAWPAGVSVLLYGKLLAEPNIILDGPDPRYEFFVVAGREDMGMPYLATSRDIYGTDWEVVR